MATQPERNMAETTSGVTGEPGSTGTPAAGNIPEQRTLVPQPLQVSATLETPTGQPADQQPSGETKESPVPGFTQEEVELFAANGISAADLIAVRNKFGPEAFLNQANARLKLFRSQQSQRSLTLEELVQRQVEERQRRIQQLQEELAILQRMPAGNDQDRVSIDSRRAAVGQELQGLMAEERARRVHELQEEQEVLQSSPVHSNQDLPARELRLTEIEQELQSLSDQQGQAASQAGGSIQEPGNTTAAEGQGSGNGGRGPEGPTPPEGPPQPPGRNTLEYEASPERGREIVKGIIEQEALVHAGKLAEVDWPKLDQLYLDMRIHVEAQRLVKTRVKINSAEESIEPDNPEIQKKVTEGAFDGFRLLAEWAAEYNRGGIAAIADKERFKKEIGVYFAEAERVGLLKDLDEVLAIAWRSVRQAIGRKETSSEVVPLINQRIQIALDTITDTFNDLAWDDDNLKMLLTGVDPRIEKLTGVWNIYAQFARERFAAAVNRRDIEAATRREYLKDETGKIQEFELGEEEEDAPEETYWRLQHGWYIEIYAQTEGEFLIAAESFISTAEAVTADPGKLIQEVDQFIDVIKRSEGRKKLGKTGPNIIRNLIWGIEARVGVFGADNANDLYNGDHYKQFLDYVNRNGKGPERYLELVKLLDALPAAALWALDNDPRWEILFSLYGARGQLSDASYVQRTRGGDNGLYQQIYNLFVEEMMGVRIRNKGDNIGNVTQFMSDSEFTSMFDGLYRHGSVSSDRYGDANIKVYEQFKEMGIDSEKDRRVPLAQRRAMRLGRIQYEIQEIRKRLADGEALRTWDNKPYDPSEHQAYHLLKNKADIRFYETELGKTSKAVDVALQIYGVLGEKSKRGGGVFKTAKKVGEEGKEYQYFVAIHKAEKFVQCAVTLTKMEYADDAAIWKKPEFVSKIRRKLSDGKSNPEYVPNFKAMYRTARVQNAMDLAIAEFKANGYEAKLYKYEYDVNGHIVGEKQQLTLKRPQEDSATGEVVYVNDKVQVDTVHVDFYTATHHPYGDWSGHTYWSYQEEDRHMILDDVTFAEARKIRKGELRAEDASMWAVQLLIIDPTLRRVRRIQDNFEDRERKLTAAAVEDSYETRREIEVKSYRAFWPRLGTPAEEIGIYYGLQDYGGFRKTVEYMRARIAEDPERFARRGRRLLPDLRNPVFPLAEYLGQGTKGALGGIRMMDAPIYRGAGTFALDKFGANAEIGGRVASPALLGGRDREGLYDEGVLLKPTNNPDKLRELMQGILNKLPKSLLAQPVGKGDWKVSGITEDIPGLQLKFAYAVMESLGRLKRYEQLLTVMETDVRNASGAMWLKDTDIFIDDEEAGEDWLSKLDELPDINKKDLTTAELASFVERTDDLARSSEGRFNRSYNKDTIDESKSPKTGTGRIGIKIFHDVFGEWLVDLDGRGGVEYYPGEQLFYNRIFDKMVYWIPDSENPGKLKLHTSEEPIWGFIFGKFVPT